MLKKKFWTLMVPFLFWNIAEGVPYYLYDPSSFSSTSFGILRDLGLSLGYGPLWYVRDILTFMVLVPFYGWIIKINKWYINTLVIFVLLWLWRPVDISFCSSEGMLFFFIGCVIWRNPKIIEYKIPSSILVFLVCLWVWYSFLHPVWNIYYHNLNTFIGVIIFWNLLNYVRNSWKLRISKCAQFSFFVYVTHFYVLKTIKIGIAHLFPRDGLVALLSFMLEPWLLMLVLSYIGYLFKSHFPKSFLFITGGRG